MQAILSIIVLIIGLIIYAISKNPEAKELGRIAFAMGLLAALLQLGGQSINLLK
jgi:Na+/phosphate symporter